MKNSMKWFLALVGCVAFAVCVYAASTQLKNTGAGLWVGTTSAQKIGFWGATPTTQNIVPTDGVNTSIAPVAVSALLSNLCAELTRTGIIRTN